MKKKILALCLVVVLAATGIVGASMAYLQDEDSDVNVMTLGNVTIEQNEYQRVVNADGTYVTDIIDGQTSYVLEPFEQGNALLPIVGDPSSPEGYLYAGYDTTRVRMTQVDSYGNADVFAGKNAQDKFVTVENMGKSDAYVRTLIAFETGSTNAIEDGLISNEIRAGKEADGVQPWTYGDAGTVTIDGNNYFYFELIYTGAKLSNGDWRHGNGVLPAGDTTYPNLCQVYLASEATNEDVEAIDGNDNGTYDILVLSQAVQTEGFANAQNALDTAFGEANATNVKAWFEGMKAPVLVSTVQELKDAMLIRGAKIVLTDDITVDANTPLQWGAYMFVANGREVTIDLNGKNITVEEEASLKTNGLFTTANGGTLNIVGEGTVEVKNGKSGIFHAMNKNDQINVYGGTYVSNSDNGSDALAIIYTNSGNVDVYGGKFIPADGVPCANAEDIQGNRLSIVFHEGTLLKHEIYYAGYDATRIQLAEGCTLQEITIDGETWYQVVKTA